jgi:hypothetical protein
MARQNGILKIKGTIGGMTFYKTQDGDLVKEKSGVDASRIASDAAFVRTRENGAEFGSSASSGKLLRDALRTLMLNVSDNRVTSRITQLMTDIKNYDVTSARGERNVGVAIVDPNAQAVLKGFDFNISSTMASTLFKPYGVDIATGIIAVNGFVPITDVAFPSGATHVSISGGMAVIDFVNEKSEVQLTNVQNLPIDAVSSNIALTPAALPVLVGTKIFLLKIEFFQQVNGNQYSLKNGAYNAMSIIEVA